MIFNDRREGRFVSVILDIHSGKERTLPRPIYALSRDGRSAVTLNFARVHRTRPGYGYVGVPDPGEDDPHPADDGIYWLDIATGGSRLIVSLEQIAAYRADEGALLREHWFNHLQFCTDDSRFLFLHRFSLPDGGRFTRMFTAEPDGSDVYLVSDQEMVSHFDWRDERHILAWARRHETGDRYFLFTDRSEEIEVVGEGVLTEDGHCSYSPDRRWILTDTYPDAESKRHLLLYNVGDGGCVEIGRFYAPPQITGEIRCDLHPRWNRDGTQVCFDSVHEGERQVYVVDVSEAISG